MEKWSDVKKSITSISEIEKQVIEQIAENASALEARRIELGCLRPNWPSAPASNSRRSHG
ncbi:hypothetical protein [Paenibacillus sp. UNC496MF]|uniref:hypothetical protein n=1 Tax=Paenibacillus sp. UNC496MF TaxID=1502753 RepID=UPI001160CFAB|nr:hypothetical protein [Paenibacillus sp. UNC496MF]